MRMLIDRVFDGGTSVLPSRLGPWPKACGVCALRRSDPLGLGRDAQEDVRNLVASGSIPFHCLHRTTAAGRNRECACAAATMRCGSDFSKRFKRKPVGLPRGGKLWCAIEFAHAANDATGASLPLAA